MKRSCLIGLDFQEFLAAIVKIAEVVHDGTYKSRDTSWEEEDEEKRMMEASDSMDRKLCCLFFHMWNTLNDKHNELQKGKFTKPFQVDEYVVFESSRIIPLSHVLSQECQLYHKKKSLENQRSNTNSALEHLQVCTHDCKIVYETVFERLQQGYVRVSVWWWWWWQ